MKGRTRWERRKKSKIKRLSERRNAIANYQKIGEWWVVPPYVGRYKLRDNILWFRLAIAPP